MKKTSEMKCGLIGKPLGHSYSPLIHSCLADYEYKLIELDENEVGSFIKSDKYDALNVTIPYKKTVMPFLDVISPEAERIGSVNTVTHLPDGRLKGDNTDYYGFSYMLDKGRIDVSGKKVLVLGSGGASMTARTVVADRGAREVVIISRNGPEQRYLSRISRPFSQTFGSSRHDIQPLENRAHSRSGREGHPVHIGTLYACGTG